MLTKGIIEGNLRVRMILYAIGRYQTFLIQALRETIELQRSRKMKKKNRRRPLAFVEQRMQNMATKWHRRDWDSCACTWSMKTSKGGKRKAEINCSQPLMWTTKFTFRRRRKSSKSRGQKSRFHLEWTYAKPHTRLHIVRKNRLSSAMSTSLPPMWSKKRL